jgi:hypothetical protein
MCMMVAGLIGAGISAAGAIAGGMAQKQMADYQAKVADINAESAVRESFAQAGATRDQYQEVAGSQRAALAKSGVDINSGTSATLGLELQRREEVAAAVDIWRGRTEATKFKNQAEAAKAEGKAAMTAGLIGGASSLIGGIANMGGGSFGSLKLGQAAATPTPITAAPAIKPLVPIPKPRPLLPKPYSLTGTVYS